jgi:ABC-2 type transport system ATP-binding protein
VVAVPEDQNLIATAPNTPSIELTNVSKWYGSVVAVNDISFQVMPGITGLLGPNGAGKTTLLHMMAGLAKPSEGEITMLGESVRNNYKLYSRMGVMSEHEAVYSVFTGRQLVEFSAKMQGITDVKGHSDWAINMVNLEDAQHRALGTYSRGMRQRMRLAASMVHDPEVLILDEPLNGTDPRQRLEFHDLMLKLAAEGRTILISSHILEEVETLADTILLVVSGKLAAAGDYRAIREKLDERPFQVRIASSDSRLLASELMKLDAIDSVTMQDDGTLLVLSRNVAVLQTSVARLAKVQGVRLHRVEPMDESLESVFTYVVAR